MTTPNLQLGTALSLLLLGTVACQSSGGGASAGPSEPGAFTLVLLRTGEAPPQLSEQEQSELFQGHFGFMTEQAEARRLLAAGPFGFEKAADDLRGLFLFDEADVARGAALAANDPTTRAGVFRQEIFPLATTTAVRRLPEFEQARQEARAAAGEDLASPDIRRYALVVAGDGENASRVLGHAALAQSVVLFGRLGAPRDGALLAVLAFEDLDEARARLAIANVGGVAFEISEWMASPALLELPGAWLGEDPQSASGPRTSSSSK